MATNAAEQLQAWKKDLEKKEKVNQTLNDRFESQMEGVPEPIVKTSRTQHDIERQRREADIEQLRFLIEDLEDRMENKAKKALDRARADLDQKKAAAKKAYLAQGGAEEIFEKLVWPEKEAALLKDAITEAVLSHEDLVRRKRETMPI